MTTDKSYLSACCQPTPTPQRTSQCSHTKLFPVSPFRSLLKCHLLPKPFPSSTRLSGSPFRVLWWQTSQGFADPVVIAHLLMSPKLSVNPPRSGSLSIMILVISPGLSWCLAHGRGSLMICWMNEWMNDLETMMKKGNDGDAWYPLLPQLAVTEHRRMSMCCLYWPSPQNLGQAFYCPLCYNNFPSQWDNGCGRSRMQ